MKYVPYKDYFKKMLELGRIVSKYVDNEILTSEELELLSLKSNEDKFVALEYYRLTVLYNNDIAPMRNNSRVISKNKRK